MTPSSFVVVVKFRDVSYQELGSVKVTVGIP